MHLHYSKVKSNKRNFSKMRKEGVFPFVVDGKEYWRCFFLEEICFTLILSSESVNIVSSMKQNNRILLFVY